MVLATCPTPCSKSTAAVRLLLARCSTRKAKSSGSGAHAGTQRHHSSQHSLHATKAVRCAAAMRHDAKRITFSRSTARIRAKPTSKVWLCSARHVMTGFTPPNGRSSGSTRPQTAVPTRNQTEYGPPGQQPPAKSHPANPTERNNPQRVRVSLPCGERLRFEPTRRPPEAKKGCVW